MEKEEDNEENEYEGLTYAQAFAKAVDEIESGAPFRCDLAKHDLWVGRERIVENGRFVGNDLGFDLVDDMLGTGESAVLNEIEEYYEKYKRSVPSERSERKERNVPQFKALPFDELTDEDMLYGERREEAKAKLEMFVLFAILSGALKWNDDWGTWFWRSERDKDLVLLKKWFETNNN